MMVDVHTHPEFERQFKRYAKKYHSLVDDFDEFLKAIRNNPYEGASLGRGIHKVRMGVASKKGGKSGGMRVITYVVTASEDGTIDVTLLYIYDKEELENISDRFIKFLLNNL